MNLDRDQLISLAREVLTLEASAVAALSERIDGDFVEACQLLYGCRGRVVVTGMGKSGHIGGKAAATLASTGTPAFFVHPGEASHGDLGMITDEDVVIAISNSGETDEILTILPLIKRLHAPLITMTGNPESRLARQADVNLDISVEQEACPLNLAPTTSTTVTLALCDALAVSLLKGRGFTAEDFARSPPGGKLGRRLLLSVGDIMHPVERTPKVSPRAMLVEALEEMSGKGLGFTTVVDDAGRLLGVYTDGDLRRTLDRQVDVRSTPVEQLMTTPCETTTADMLAVEALNQMEGRILTLPVVDENHIVIGALHMHDLLRAGVV
ncbi:MAG TPA: KpsF/GutQ family sugar-phosphate isomerase [Gammaproteobacteria bacterium]|nr:KpsF/GutQ family sugar-phosphate isomerase [Gammaproteobacteria bacterium]